MDNENPNEINKTGANNEQTLAADGQPLSDYDKALELVKRREKATEAEKEILERKEKLAANSMLGGTSGGNIPAKVIPEAEAKVQRAAKFFEGTALEGAINNANAKK